MAHPLTPAQLRLPSPLRFSKSGFPRTRLNSIGQRVDSIAGGLSKIMAEREGFEPPIPVKVCPLSRRIVSTAHAPLRKNHQHSAISRQPKLLRPADAEKLLQNLRTLTRQHAAANFHLVVQARMVQYMHH